MLLLKHVQIIDLDVTPIESPEPMTLYYGSRGSSDTLEVYVCLQDGRLRKLGGGSSEAAPIVKIKGHPRPDASGEINNYYPDMIFPAPYDLQSNGVDFMLRSGQVISMSGVVNAAGCRNREANDVYIFTSWNVDITLACNKLGQIIVIDKKIVAASSPMDNVNDNFWNLDVYTQNYYYPTPEEEDQGFVPHEPLFAFVMSGGAGVWQVAYAEVEITGKLLFTISDASQFLTE